MKIWKGLVIVGLIMIITGFFIIGENQIVSPLLMIGIFVFIGGLAIGFDRFIRRAKYE